MLSIAKVMACGFITFYAVPFLVRLTPNPPKRWAVALTPGMMGKGRRTGQARFQ